MIKKAYLQEEECENAEVSPREVGHNIYILALQVLSCDSRDPARLGSPCCAGLPLTDLHIFFSIFIYISSSQAGLLREAWLGNVLSAPVKSQPPGLPAVPLPCAPRVLLPCSPVAACQSVLTRLFLSLFQLSRHNKSLQQLLKPVKRIQEEEEEGISSMVWKGLGNGGSVPRP